MITLRIRSMMWFSAGLALALGLVWGTLAWPAEAAPGASESTIVAVTPVRVLDTRDSSPIGLPGPFRSLVPQKLQVTGLISTGAGTTTVVPVGATGVLLNVTVVNPSAAGFLGIRPGDAAGLPPTSSLNFTAFQTIPNAVQVILPTSGPNAGQIDIAYNAGDQAGPTTEVVIDVVGYTTSAGLQELVADVARKANTADVNAGLAAKANSADVYTRAQSDGRYPQGYAIRSNSLVVQNWPIGATRGVEVLCPSGMVPTGGGGFHDNAAFGDVTISMSFSNANTTGWFVVYKSVSNAIIPSRLIIADVVCMSVPGEPRPLVGVADDLRTLDGT